MEIERKHYWWDEARPCAVISASDSILCFDTIIMSWLIWTTGRTSRKSNEISVPFYTQRFFWRTNKIKKVRENWLIEVCLKKPL